MTPPLPKRPLPRGGESSTKVYSYQGHNLATVQEYTGGAGRAAERAYTVAPGALRGTCSGSAAPEGRENGTCPPTRHETDRDGDPVSDTPDISLTGKDYDATLDRFHFNARWYDPETGRFLSRADQFRGDESGTIPNPIVAITLPAGTEISIASPDFPQYRFPLLRSRCPLEP